MNEFSDLSGTGTVKCLVNARLPVQSLDLGISEKFVAVDKSVPNPQCYASDPAAKNVPPQVAFKLMFT